MIQNRLLFSIFFLISHFSYSQLDSGLKKTLKIHFLYGSKPAKGYKKTEHKWFGGLHGGHVYMQDTDSLFSFYPSSNWHIFSHKKTIGGAFLMDDPIYWKKDTTLEKYTSIEIPVTETQLTLYNNIRKQYLIKSPYDYAFFGMRCASATYDILSQIGVVKKHSRFRTICKNFYPKPFRKRLLKLAVKNNWTITRKQGRPSLKWEKD